MTNVKAQMTNEIQSSNEQKLYDLEERTAQFGENVIDFVKTLPQDSINRELCGYK